MILCWTVVVLCCCALRTRFRGWLIIGYDLHLRAGQSLKHKPLDPGEPPQFLQSMVAQCESLLFTQPSC